MKKCMAALLWISMVLVTLLTACTSSKQARGSLLEFPETTWNMTPEEVMTACGFSADSIMDSEAGEEPHTFGVENWECFGAKTQNAVFTFQADENGVQRLVHVSLVYPDDADMAEVKRQLTDTYGSSLKQFTSLTAGGGGTGYQEEVLEETDHFAFWHSTVSVSEYLDEAQMRAFLETAERRDAELNAGGAWKAYALEIPLVQITWEDDAQLPGQVSGSFSYPKNQVEFNASILHYLPEMTKSS